MQTTILEPNDLTNSDQDKYYKDESLLKNKTNFICPTTNIDSDSQFNEFICDLIRKQNENENKLKSDISTRSRRVVSHIYEKLERGHGQIYDYKLKDYLLSIGYDKESTNQVISYLVDSYDGSLELDDLKTFFNLFESSGWNFKADMHLKKMLSCPLVPGFIDAFCEDNTISKYEHLSEKLFKFMLSHRLPAEQINEPYLENRILVSNLKRKMLILTEETFYEEYGRNKTVCLDQQCTSSLKSCCSNDKIKNVLDGKSTTYWQTSNLEKCENHWILIMLKENIKLTNLSLCSIGNKTDEFLKTVVIEVLAGSSNKLETIVSKCDYNLTLNNEYTICNCFPNNQKITFLKIVFKRTTEKNYWGKNNDQIKIKSIKIAGKKVLAEPASVTVQDASICWYFEMLSSIALIQSQLMPSLHSKILQITKNALQNMPPLSLTLDSKNTFLTPTVLEKVDSFLKNFLEVTSTSTIDKSEAILIYLSFNLARGNLKAIMSSLVLLLENSDLNYDYPEIVTKINEASQLSLKKTARTVNFKLLNIPNEEKNEKLNETEVISSICEETNEFVLESSKSFKGTLFEANICYSMVLEIQNNVTLTNINLQLKLESIGIQSVIVILLFDKDKPNLEKFSQFDSIKNKEQFDSYMKNRNSSVSTKKHEKTYEAFFFELYDNQIDILLELPVTDVAKYAIVKFIRQKENSQKSITVSKLKCIGYKHSSLELYEHLRKLPKSLNEQTNPAAILINTVLWFCCHLAEQHNNSNSKNDDIVEFLNFENFEINDLWKIYAKSLEMNKHQSQKSHSIYANLKIPILILLFELVHCDEIKTNIKLSKKSSHILEHLCNIIDGNDNQKMSGQYNELSQILQFITKEIIKNGICCFFPQSEQIELFESIIEQNTKSRKSEIKEEEKEDVIPKHDMSLKRVSNQILFEAFCKQFSKNKLALMQYITKNQNIYENCSDLSQIVLFQEKLLNLCFSLDSDVNHETETKIVQIANVLLNSIQSNVLYNIRSRLNSKIIDRNCIFENIMLKNINSFIYEYTGLLIRQSDFLIESLNKCNEEEKSKIALKLKELYGGLLYSFVLWLKEILDSLDMEFCTNLVKFLIDFYISIQSLFIEHFADDKKFENEKLLKTWTFNSKTKNSLLDMTIDYSYPLARRFVIDFDTNSNLIFTESSEITTYSLIDSSEKIYLLSGKIGSGSWSEQMEIKSNSYLTFKIRSSKDLKLNNSFYLKFNVSAYGYDVPLNETTFVDLLDSLTSLFAMHLNQVCSKLMKEPNEIIDNSEGLKSALEKSNSKDESQEKTPEFLLCGFQHQLSINSSTQALIGASVNDQIFTDMNHEFYRILFRGGLVENETTLKDNKFYQFLVKVSNYYTDETNKDLIQNFMSLYDKSYESQEKLLKSCINKIGGMAINEIILRLFCAILWQDPSINYECLFDANDKPIYNEHVSLAFKSAESTRMFIVEKQQIHKIKNSKNLIVKSLAEILNEKILFIFKLNRIPIDLLDYELSKIENRQIINETLNDNLMFTKKKTRIPKTESIKINLIFEFVFDKNINNLDMLEKILLKKTLNSNLIYENFDLACKFMQNVISDVQDEKFKHERLLIFFSNFYSTESNSKFTVNYEPKTSTSNKKLNIIFPPTLKSHLTHYLQGLYACGLDNENQVQKSFFNFVKILVEFSNRDFSTLSKQERYLNIRLKSFITCLLDIDWELYDLKFFAESNLFSYVLNNTIQSLPIGDYKDSKQSLPSDILEDIFDLSKEKFDEVMAFMKLNKENVNLEGVSSKSQRLSSVKEIDEKDEEKKILPKDENDSFDLKIFPKMYQSVFQINNSKQFDTASLIKCVSAEIKTYDKYEKYIVARYMFWKYFSKLNTNFYCDSCDVVLTGFRYVCLECRDHCLCFSCFGKSIVDEKCESNEPKYHKPMINFTTSTHKPSHAMLVLDHYCNQCQSLIIGKRLRCSECKDYDLCLTCSKNPEYSDEGHKKDHKMEFCEPLILTSRSHEISDAQVFFYLHSQYQLNFFSLKICDMLKKYADSANQYVPYLSKLFYQVLNTNLYLSNQAGMESLGNIIVNKEFSRALKLYSFYNQENLIGLLALIIKTAKNVIRKNDNSENVELNFDAMMSIYNESKSENVLQDLYEPNLVQILNFLLTIQNKMCEKFFMDNICVMFIDLMKPLLAVLEPSVVDSVAKYHLEKNETKIIFDTIHPTKREFMLELLFCWIYENMNNDFQKWASCYLSLLFSLNQKDLWRPRVENFLCNIFDNISESLDNYKVKIHSKFYFFMYSIVCFQMVITSGQWIDYKNKSLYDGAGILRSKNDFKIGLINNIYSETYNLGYFVSLNEPESRRSVFLKNQKLDSNFKKSNENSKINLKSSFDLTDEHFGKLIEILKKIFPKNQDEKMEFSTGNELASTKVLQVYETAHINRKRDFYKNFKNKLSFNNNLLLLALVNLLRNYVDTKLNIDNEDLLLGENKIYDNEFLGLISKISFMNTNLNSNWKLVHLRHLLSSLLVFDNFANVTETLDKGEIKETDQISESDSNKKTSSLINKNESKNKQNRSSSLMDTFSINTNENKKSTSDKQDLTLEDLTLGYSNNAVMGICDNSSLIFNVEDMIEDYQPRETNDKKKNEISLKLIEDCLTKLGKYDSSAISNSKNDDVNNKISQLISNKYTSSEPLKAAIKIVSNASIVLSCRELLILFVNLFSKLKNNKQKSLASKEEVYTFNELNCRSEFEFIQLLDILYYSENLSKFKVLIKNLIKSFLETENNSALKILNKISLMTCDFMIPEFKLIKKVAWSSEDMRIYDTGRIKNKISSEEISQEDNFDFNSNQMLKNLNDLEKLSNITAKPNDIEKLSTQDQSNLLIVFDQSQKKNTSFTPGILNSNQKSRITKYGKFLSDSKLKKNKISSHEKYCLGDDFERDACQNDVSDTESVDSILEESELAKDKKKSNTKKRYKSNNDTLNDVYTNPIYDSDEDDDEDMCDDSSDISTQTSSDSETKKKKAKINKKTSILFQVYTKNKESNNEDDEENENEDDDDDDDNDEDNESGDDSNSDSSDEETEDYNQNSDSDQHGFDYSTDEWYTSVNNTNYSENEDENKPKKISFKISLENLENVPYIAVKNQKILKWKFCRTDWSTESCSFKIYTTLSKNFESAYHILDEIISQCSKLDLNDLWSSLIKICCVQAFTKRLKILSLLIKIIRKVYQNSETKNCINLFELRPLKNLHYTLEFSNKDDKNFSRALYELFFFAEKLAIKWSIQCEYVARMKDKTYFLEKISETSYFINLIAGSINNHEKRAKIDESDHVGNNIKVKSVNDLFFTDEMDNETNEMANDEESDTSSNSQECFDENNYENHRESDDEQNYGGDEDDLDPYKEKW
ncbi:unnamed protein product [Brachionus calyciflorus]|uniref:ZZ-type domain-containing protein n=1 Tax=Brachionus calyciflorus TaxID=104777 RepID=A0A813QF03_9BILA|nr:unnamed protein product [Brachionus calyciflorus]